MATRTDVSVEYNSSPRVVEVAAPSVEMVMQDWVDTLRKQEDSFQGMAFTKLLNASGKEDLGGGVLVGITAASQDTLLAFEGRTTPAETGTVTSNPGSPIAGRDAFIDTAALFQTANVARGSLVINFTDNSIAEVYSVDSETQLTTKTLVNGIGNTFDAADVYHIFNVVQCNATGGNLTAVNTVPATISPILPTAFTQIILTASSSATTSNLESLEAATFQGGVAISVATGTAGTAFPQGTREFPVNNMTDAKTISDARGLSKFFVLDNLTVTGIDLSNEFHHFIGDRPGVLLTLDVSANLTGNNFTDLTLSGVMGGNNVCTNCIIFISITEVSGRMVNCGFAIAAIGLNGRLTVVDGYIIGAFAPNFTVGLGNELINFGFRGDISIGGVEDGIALVDLNAGRLLIQSSCTGGTIRITGTYTDKPTDNSTGSSIKDESISFKQFEMYERLDLDVTRPNTYTRNNDNTITITGTDWILTETLNPDTTKTVQRS